MFDPYTPISFPMLSFPRPCYHLYYPQTSFSIFSLSRSPTRPRLLSFDSLPNEGCFVTVEHVSRLSFKHVHLAFFSRVCHTASFSPCPSFLLSLPFLFYTPFSTWSSRRIHSRDTPFFFFFFSSSFFPLPFHFIPFFSARTQTYRTTSRFTSLGDMSFSTLVEPGSLSLSLPRTNRPLVTGRVSRWNDGVGFVFVDEGQGATDG